MTGDRQPVPTVHEPGLLARAAAGREEAVAELFDTFGGALYGYGLRRLGSPDLAEELVQRVMTRLWRTGSRYDPTRSSVRSWVFTIARSVAVDLWRAQPGPASAADAAWRGHPPDELEALLHAEAVRLALGRLSAEHREVLELAYFRGLPQREIASRLHVPLGTVKSRTYYALKALRLACDELGVQA